jgi:outer membrane lipoprotein-sorting protein
MRKGIFFLAFALFVSGCATLPVLPPQPPPPAEDLLKRVEARLQMVQGLKGLARVKVSSTAKNFQVQEVLFIQRPALLRCESLGLLGTPQLYLVTDGRELSLYDPGENRYYRGPATARHLSSALPVILEPQEAVAFLLGGLPLIDPETSSLREDRQEGLWILDLVSTTRGERQSLWVHPQSVQILRAESHRSGSSRRLTFSDFSQVQGIFFPRRIQLTSSEPEGQISVEYQEVELNPSWKNEDFRLPVPRGAKIIPWK